MSSLRVAVRGGAADQLAEAGEDAVWIPVVSPLDAEPVGDTTAVITAITALRDRYRVGTDESVEIDPVPTYGCGDAETADMVAEDMAGRWDN